MATSYAWNTGNVRVANGWIISTLILPDEIFSSWLVRAALANGSDPLAFTSALWPMWRIWISDIDRRLPEERGEELATLCGVAVNKLVECTLAPIAMRIVGNPLPEKNIWPWILAVGARNRHRSGGLQYCPACLSGDSKPYYRIHWRFAWHTACVRHGCMLHDRCPSCSAAIEPHRIMAERQSIVFCPTCSEDLRHGTTVGAAEQAMRFQLQADQALSSDSVLVHGNMASTREEWFSIARFYWGLVRRVADGRTSSLLRFFNDSGLSRAGIKPGAFSIELARTNDRHDMLGGVSILMSLPAAKLGDLLESSGVTMQAFRPNRVELPRLLVDIASRLINRPVTRCRKQKKGLIVTLVPKSRYEVKLMMARLMRRIGRLSP